MLRPFLCSLLLCSATLAAAQNARNPMQQANDAADELVAMSLAPSPVAREAYPAPAPKRQLDGPVRISGGVMDRQVLTRVAPIYPPEARAKRLEGAVVLSAKIGKDGNVEDLNVISGPAMLGEAATEAVRQWTYRPYELNGSPVEVLTVVTLHFDLNSTR